MIKRLLAFIGISVVLCSQVYAETPASVNYPVSGSQMASQVGKYPSFKVYRASEDGKQITITDISTDTDSILSKTLVVEKGERINPSVEYEYINGIVRSGKITYTFSDVYRSDDLYLADKAELYKNALSVYDKAKSELLAAGYEDLTKPSGAKYKKGDVVVEVQALMNSYNLFVVIEATYQPPIDLYRN
jgi:hypothetical protein